MRGYLFGKGMLWLRLWHNTQKKEPRDNWIGRVAAAVAAVARVGIDFGGSAGPVERNRGENICILDTGDRYITHNNNNIIQSNVKVSGFAGEDRCPVTQLPTQDEEDY